jgi:hypothetical protein
MFCIVFSVKSLKVCLLKIVIRKLTLSAEHHIVNLAETPLGHIRRTAVCCHALVHSVLVVELAVFVLVRLLPAGDG